MGVIVDLLHGDAEATRGPLGAELEEEDEEGDVEKRRHPDEVVLGKVIPKHPLVS